MQQPNTTEIVFDRETRKLTAPSFKYIAQARLMQASHMALSYCGYLGISRVHGMVNSVLKPATDTVVVEQSWRFRFPSNDYYWNRLLDAGWDYEPEIDFVLQKLADVPFTFLDLGANFGFWSSRVGCGCYSEHNSIAVEASSYCLPILLKNTTGTRYPVNTHHRAIDEVSGRELKLFGQRHAGCSIDGQWYGASTEVANVIQTVAIDDLLAQEDVNPVDQPVIVKLDVEGVELRAMKGGTLTANGKSLWLIEDAEFGTVSDAVLYAQDELAMTLYLFKDDEITKLSSLDELRAIKSKGSRLQGTGINLIATSSQFWIDAISGLNKQKIANPVAK